MEVHAHSHTSRKKWTHYLWEFLMLFLAVFCGFLAENQREHMIEHKREKQYINSLINDLQLDIAWFDSVSNSARSRITNIDSAILFFSGSESNNMPVNIYKCLQRSTIQIMFFANNGTTTQLKNSGGMRLIRNRAAVDSIEAYDRLMRRLEVRRDIANQITHDFTVALNKTVVGRDLLGALYDSAFFNKMILPGRSINLNSQNLNELINTSIVLRLRAVSDIGVNESIKKTAQSLIGFLKQKYHLD